MFVLGSIMGRLYVESGAGVSIAKGVMSLVGKEKASDTSKHIAVILTVLVTGGLLGYGGVNVVAIPVALYPLILSLMEEADIPKRHVIGLSLSAFATFAMTGPGTPQIQNIIPSTILGTSSTAGLIPGIIASLIIIIGNILFLNWMFAKDKARGLHFSYGQGDVVFDEKKVLPNIWVSLIPLVTIFVAFNGFKLDISVSLLIGAVLALILFFSNIEGGVLGIRKALNEGAMFACQGTLNIAALAAFGAVVRIAPIFMEIVKGVASLDGNPLVISVFATAAGAGLTGSASGGITVALPVVAPLFEGLVNPDALHRSVTIASSSLDTLPFNGGFLMFLSLTGLTHKEAYPTTFFTTVVMTSLGAILCMLICIFFPGLV